MSIVETTYEHIIIEQNQPMIKGTHTKVRDLVLDKIAYGWSPDEIHYQHSYLTLGQIYSALAYYADHQEEMDKEIETQLRDIDQLKNKIQPTPLLKKLKAKKLI